MEQTLNRLFDFQKFCRSKKLADVIDSVHKSMESARELSDDEAEIWAAGDPVPALPVDQKNTEDQNR